MVILKMKNCPNQVLVCPSSKEAKRQMDKVFHTSSKLNPE
jgi:hypothetical protein